jgi:hypothetical protein
MLTWGKTILIKENLKLLIGKIRQKWRFLLSDNGYRFEGLLSLANERGFIQRNAGASWSIVNMIKAQAAKLRNNLF